MVFKKRRVHLLLILCAASIVLLLSRKSAKVTLSQRSVSGTASSTQTSDDVSGTASSTQASDDVSGTASSTQTSDDRKRSHTSFVTQHNNMTRVTQHNNMTRDLTKLHPRRVVTDTYNYLATPDACTGTKPLYISYVHSNPKNPANRDLQRATWANRTRYPPFFLGTIFVLGVTVNETEKLRSNIFDEALKHQDILYVNFTDSFWTLTDKAVVAMEFITNRCQGVKYVIKSDDDTLIHMPALHSHMSTVDPTSLSISCWVFDGMPVIRNIGSTKYYVPPEVYPIHKPDRYPKYCSGTGLTMTFKVFERLLTRVPYEPFITIDDAYFTGFLAEHLPEKDLINWRRIPMVSTYKRALLRLTTFKDPHKFVFILEIKRRDHYLDMFDILQNIDKKAGQRIPMH